MFVPDRYPATSRPTLPLHFNERSPQPFSGAEPEASHADSERNVDLRDIAKLSDHPEPVSVEDE